MAFVSDMVEREVARPLKHLAALVEVWEAALPAELAARSRLTSLRRGLLTVTVADSATLYAIDQHLRGGVTGELKRGSKATLNKVKLVIGALDAPRGRGG